MDVELQSYSVILLLCMSTNLLIHVTLKITKQIMLC
jgi:hypothetical protein